MFRFPDVPAGIPEIPAIYFISARSAGIYIPALLAGIPCSWQEFLGGAGIFYFIPAEFLLTQQEFHIPGGNSCCFQQNQSFGIGK